MKSIFMIKLIISSLVSTTSGNFVMSPNLEIYNAQTHKTIKSHKIDQKVRNEIVEITKSLTLYVKLKIDLNGTIVKIPLDKKIAVSDITPEAIKEIRLYLGNSSDNDIPNQLIFLVTDSNKIYICTSKHDFKSFIQSL